MLKYLIVQLDDTSPSFCHYHNSRQNRRLIPIDNLRKALVWAMKENLMVQFVYPDYSLPKEYLELIDTVDHIDIEHDNQDADVSVFTGTESFVILKEKKYPNVVLRLSKSELFNYVDDILTILKNQPSLNIVITDIESFNDEDFDVYKRVLEELAQTVIDKLKINATTNLNLLTNRLLLDAMNNCNAGDDSITIAPDGNFYICPAFYLEGMDNVGNPIDGVSIPNQRLYKLDYAPICKTCDAYQCKRCTWLNQKLTGEVNTPGREQCIIAHLERNASRELLEIIKTSGMIKTDKLIPEIDYLDPFEKITH